VHGAEEGEGAGLPAKLWSAMRALVPNNPNGDSIGSREQIPTVSRAIFRFH